MKSIILTSFLLIFHASITSAQTWLTDMDTAIELAESSEKNILLVFSGSDWCAPCIKLDKQIWNTETFKSYAEDNFVLVKADFPKRKKNELSATLTESNDALAEQYNPRGAFPLVVVLNPAGEVLGKTGYKDMEPMAYIDHLNGL